MKSNRLTHVLLGFLTLGVWGLLLNVTLQNWTPIAEAQTKKTPPNQIRRKYEVASVDDRGNVTFGGDGTVVLTARGLQAVLATASAQGWKVHSIVFADLGAIKGWSVIVEK